MFITRDVSPGTCDGMAMVRLFIWFLLLGLSIVKHIVENLNGSITVVSDLNQGTEFQIKLPKNSR